MTQPFRQAWDLVVSSRLTIAAFVFLGASYAIYRALLPKPFPGVPYDKAASKTVFGDLASFKKEGNGNFLDWVTRRAISHGTPLCQIFIPLHQPVLILSDYREAQDIFMRQTKIWDRSDWSIARLGAGLPRHHINMKTDDGWKSNRRLIQDLMSAPFLHNVAAPNLYESTQDLIQLWAAKARLAHGKPFSASKDIFHAALDAVLAFSFGDSFPHRALTPQVELVQAPGSGLFESSYVPQEPVVFEEAPLHETLMAMLHVAVNIGQAINSMSPGLVSMWQKIEPLSTRMRGIRVRYIEQQITQAVERLEGRVLEEDLASTKGLKSAVDLMVSREKRFAIKEGRAPNYQSNEMNDEVAGFVVAGHDTTSTTLLWALKFLTDNSQAQTKLREALHKAHQAASQENRMPNVEEIVKTSIPYLDAFNEEVLRCSCTIPSTSRQCSQDTTVLGHVVPKGTTMLILNAGPCITHPGHSISESIRSKSCQAAAKERGVREWDPRGIDQFDPERWLVSEGEHTSFDSTAGPTLAFGVGLRGCYGRKLAYLEMRIIMTLFVWNFEFMQCPEELSSYDPVEELTRKPKMCYIRLKPLGHD
ncbi:hypothetical protein S40288_00895 [Stachybotrys chartarum IBT 40288]|nr:hypothetical protein S40288_00895 [Stachybotrys chartarum IBT 40288]